MRKLEIASHVAVICAALLLCYVLVTDGILTPRHRAPNQLVQNAQGQTLSIPGVDWSRSDRSLVLAISSHCPFCIRSTAFYQQLSKLKSEKHSSVRLIAVLPEDTGGAESFLQAHQVRVDQVADASLADLHVQGTPTLFVVDSHGKITKEWVGMLSPESEKQVIASL